MKPPRGRLWIWMTALFASSGCFAPAQPDFLEAETNFPPEVLLGTLDPPGGIIPISRLDCSTFRVEVGAIVDQDDEDLLFRWVANNDLPGTRVVSPTLRSSAPPGEPRPAFARVDPQIDFRREWEATDPNTGPEPSATGLLSLFVTDAPAWAEPDPVIPEDEARDLSRIVGGGTDGGRAPYSVVEVRWGVVIGEEFIGECPQ